MKYSKAEVLKMSLTKAQRDYVNSKFYQLPDNEEPTFTVDKDINIDCVNCTGCNYCLRCYNCSGCVNCNGCRDCNKCFICDSCEGLNDCVSVNYITCYNCDGCNYCKKGVYSVNTKPEEESIHRLP